MNVMFIDPPSLQGGASENVSIGDGTNLTSPNMGILYMATYLKSKTHAKVSILDMAANNIEFTRLPDIFKYFQPSLVCISSKTFNILSTYKISRIVKKINPKTAVLVGGAHPTALPEHTLIECHNIDAVALREGENTVLDLYERMKDGYELPNVFVDLPGVVYRNGTGQIVHNEERRLIKDLDALPFPDFSLVNYKRYKKVYNPNKHRFQYMYPIFASRGCPFNCTFCMPLHTRKYRVRSIENILDEIAMLNKKYGAQRIYFEDSLFGAQKEWFLGFCEKYKKKGLHKKVQWGFETRIDTVDIEMFSQAKSSGCIYTFFGVESGSERVLKKAKKSYSKPSIMEKVTAAKEAGIDDVHISIILGLPYETTETIEETLSLVKELPCDWANMNILDVYPGTTTFEMADKGEGGLRWLDGKRMNWDAYSRSEPMVEVNDVSSEYLLKSREKGLKIVDGKKKKDKIALIIKRLVQAIEYARTDRPRLIKKLGDILIPSRD